MTRAINDRLTNFHISSPPVVVDRDYYYKSVVNQIPHDARLAPISYSCRKFLPNQGSNLRRIPYESKTLCSETACPKSPDERLYSITYLCSSNEIGNHV